MRAIFLPTTLICLATCGLVTASCVLPRDLAGREILDLGSFAPCQQCELQFRSVATIGASTGDGTIDAELPWVVARPGGGYLIIDSPTRLKLFDAAGDFVRAVGREGEGPGELESIWSGAAFSRDGRIVVLDADKRAWTQFTEGGEFIARAPQDLSPGQFLLLEGDTLAVVVSMDRRPNSVGYPLHVVDIRDGTVVRHFGSLDGAWDMSEPAATRIALGRDAAARNRVWWGKMGRLHLEEWSVNGVLIRTVTGDLPWFPPIPGPEARVPGQPLTFMPTFAVDDDDRLWMITVMPDERWREVERSGPEGAVSAGSSAMMRDSRLDVFDLRSQTHLGFKVWDAPKLRLVVQDGRVLVPTLEYDRSLDPRVILHEADLPPAGR